MLIFIQTVGQVFPFVVSENTTVNDLKKVIEDREFIPTGSVFNFIISFKMTIAINE
jgi:hypothetical protein